MEDFNRNSEIEVLTESFVKLVNTEAFAEGSPNDSLRAQVTELRSLTGIRLLAALDPSRLVPAKLMPKQEQTPWC